MTKFEANGIQKQEDAYLKGYADKAFKYSCYECSTRNLDCHHHGCDNCPIAVAHAKAIKEIENGKRERPTPFGYGGAFSRNNRHGGTTLVLRFDNCTFNMNSNDKKEGK